MITLEEGVSKVPMFELAKVLGVTPGTATSMAKTLEHDSWIKYFPRVEISDP